MKIQKIIIFLVVVFLLPLLLVENVSKADEVDKGNYIKIKLQVDALTGGDEVYNAYASSGSTPDDNPFNVTGTSYSPGAITYECALLLSERNIAFDDLYVVWVKNEVIIGRGSSLSNDIGSDYDRCCHGIDTDSSSTSCLTDGGEARCQWGGVTDGNVHEVFVRSYANLENQCPSDAVCTFAPNVGPSPAASRSYGEFSDMLCETEWRMCLGPNDTCHTYNGRNYACNDSSGDFQWENCTAAGKTCTSGACVAALSLAASTSAAMLAPSGTATITYTVELSGTGIAGATVNGISVTANGGSISAGTIGNNCLSENTDSNGECTVTYNAPNAVPTTNPVVITATNATLAPNSPSGNASVIISINGCPAPPPTNIACTGNPDCLQPTVCTSDGVRHRYINPSTGTGSCNFGTSICSANVFNCPMGCTSTCNDCLECTLNTCLPDGSKWCKQWASSKQYTPCDGSSGEPACCVVAATCASDGIVCSVNGDCCNSNCNGGTCCTTNISCSSSACTKINLTSAKVTTTCTDANGCVGATSSTADCCLNNGHCAGGTPVCNPATEQCVQCVNNDDCAGTDVCNLSNNTCTPCKAEGEAALDAFLCCEGLDWWDKNGTGVGTEVCTSACNPDAWFFCNPLRKSVETIVEAGETMLGYILGLIGSVALLFIIIAGVMYMTSAGNEEKISSSKKILSGAVIGLMIALLAYGLLHVIMTVLGM